MTSWYQQLGIGLFPVSAPAFNFGWHGDEMELVIRRVNSLNHEVPVFMGVFCIRRDPFRLLGAERSAKLRDENEKRPGEFAQYHNTIFIHPDFGGKGIVTVSSFVLAACSTPAQCIKFIPRHLFVMSCARAHTTSFSPGSRTHSSSRPPFHSP